MFEGASTASLEGGGSGTPDFTVEPSGGVVGLIRRNTDEGRCLPDDPCEELAMWLVFRTWMKGMGWV